MRIGSVDALGISPQLALKYGARLLIGADTGASDVRPSPLAKDVNRTVTNGTKATNDLQLMSVSCFLRFF